MSKAFETDSDNSEIMNCETINQGHSLEKCYGTAKAIYYIFGVNDNKIQKHEICGLRYT